MKKKKKPIKFHKPNAMAANFALAHTFKDRRKEQSRKACKKENWDEDRD